jgi:hypothetical protein
MDAHNDSMKPNRRWTLALVAEQKLGHDIHGPAFLTAAFAYFGG